jgi:hypothetical protein
VSFRSFNDKLQQDFPYIRKSKWEDKVECTLCNSTFSISHGGTADTSDHVNKRKHKDATLPSSSNKITYFFKPKVAGKEELKSAAEEGTFTYHTIKHKHSFRSMECTSSIIRKVLNRSSFTFGRTKCEKILVNVLAPFAMKAIVKELEAPRFIAVMIDSSNHNHLKVVSVPVRYFVPNLGIKVRIIEFSNLGCETAETQVAYIMEILNKYDLLGKVIALSADNTNTNLVVPKEREETMFFGNWGR